MAAIAWAGVRCVTMGIRDRLLSGAARQLGKPEGVTGQLLAIGLNRGNRGIVTAAVDAAQIAPAEVADLLAKSGLTQVREERVGDGNAPITCSSLCTTKPCREATLPPRLLVHWLSPGVA
jgi:hypothetical protein